MLLYLAITVLVLAAVLVYSMANRSSGWLRKLQAIFYALLIVISTIVYYDANALNTHFFSSDNIMLLQENSTLLTGIRGKVAEAPEAIARQQLEQFQPLFEQQRYPEIRGDSYKLFIFSTAAFSNFSTMPFGDIEMSGSEAFIILRSPDALDQFAELVVSKKNPKDPTSAKVTIKNRFTDAEELKAKLFSVLIGTASNQQGKALIPTAYRQKVLIVETRSPYFLFLAYMPSFVVDTVVAKG